MTDSVERADIGPLQRVAGRSRAPNTGSIGRTPKGAQADGLPRDPAHDSFQSSEPRPEEPTLSSLDEECEWLLRSGRRPDTAALAAKHGVSQRTAQRRLKAARKRIGNAVSIGPAASGRDLRPAPSSGCGAADAGRPAGYYRSDTGDQADRATDRVWRALTYMGRVWTRGVVSREELISLGLRTRKDRGGTLSRRTVERDLSWLVREGILDESAKDSGQTYYKLGPHVASDSGLSCEELARLLGYLEVRMQTSPHRTFLRSAYARIDWNSALRRDRSIYDKLVSAVETQSEYCIIQGRLPQMDVHEAKLLRDVETAIRERRKLSVVYEPRKRQGVVRWKPPDTPGGLETGPDINANANTNANVGDGAPPNDNRNVNANAEADAGEPEIVSPLGIVYYWVLDAWYLVSEADPESRWMRGVTPPSSRDGEPHKNLQLWRLDRIRSLSVTDIPFTYPQGFDLHTLFADRWGLQGGDRMHVRVRFYDDFNVVNRVRAETAHRRNRVLHEEPDGTWIYEDDVVGFDDFRMWLRSFGASAEVLEPENLRAAMRESALKMRERYGEPGAACAGRSAADEAGADQAEGES